MSVIALTPRLADLYADQVISSRHFGANMIFDRDRFHTSPDGPAGTYGTALELLGVDTIRYPGGTVTELVFDLANPNATKPTFELVPNYRLFDPDRQGPLQPSLLGLDQAIRQAGQHDLDMTFVMPTLRFLGKTTDMSGNRNAVVDEALVYSFTFDLLADALANGVTLQAIELGNEWWIDNSALLGGVRMSAVEYGRVASTLAAVIQEAIDQFKSTLPSRTIWTEPDILVQVGPGADAEMVMANGHRPTSGYAGNLFRATELIFNEFDRDIEQAAVDGLLTHRYQVNAFHNINGWAYVPFETWESLASKDTDFQSLEYYVTEWNVAARNANYTGLLQAGAIVALFSEMVTAGVDHANVWAVQQRNETRLTDNVGWNGDTTVDLSLAGKVFQMLNNSVQGMQAIPLLQTSSDYSTRAFGDTDAVVLYVSNLSGRADQLSFDVGAIANRIIDVDGLALALAGTDPLSNSADPVVTSLSSLVFTRPSEISFWLGAYQTAEIVISLGNVMAASSAYGERVLGSSGSDSLSGYGGSDSLYGFAGRDTLLGGTGDDSLDGGAQSDTLLGGEGNDRLFGCYGNDRLAGGDGRDNLDGGFGHDILHGDAGDDVIGGGAGNDTLIGGVGTDWLTPGIGVDSVDGGWGSDMVSYYDAGSRAVIDLVAGTAVVGTETDRLIRIENITATIFGDLITGDAGANRIRALGDYDWMLGSGGGDTFEGGTGRDMVAYSGALAGVVASLITDTGTRGQASGDRYVDVENLTGSSFNDTLTGDHDRNVLRGLGGDDFIFGNGGSDTIDGGAGRDTLDGGLLNDRITGGRGNDFITGGNGWDTAIFSGARTEYTVTALADGRTAVLHSAGGIDGLDILRTVEVLQFSDTLVFL